MALVKSQNGKTTERRLVPVWSSWYLGWKMNCGTLPGKPDLYSRKAACGFRRWLLFGMDAAASDCQKLATLFGGRK